MHNSNVKLSLCESLVSHLQGLTYIKIGYSGTTLGRGCSPNPFLLGLNFPLLMLSGFY